MFTRLNLGTANGLAISKDREPCSCELGLLIPFKRCAPISDARLTDGFHHIHLAWVSDGPDKAVEPELGREAL